MMEKRIALSYYALPKDYLAALEAKAGGPVRNVVVSSLRGQHALDILAQLRRIEANTIYVPTPSRDWLAFAPLLRIIAQVPRAQRVLLADESLTLRHDSVLHVLPAILTLMAVTTVTLMRVVLQFARLRALAATPRQDCAAPGEPGEILYIKSNLWAGVTAGGSISHTSGVIKALSDLGNRVTFVSPGDAPELTAIAGASVKRVALSHGFIYPRELNSYRYNRTLERWTGRLPRQRFGLVYHRLSLGSFAAVLTARRLKIPLVVEYNGSEVWINRNWGTPLKLERFATLVEDAVLRHAHVIVTVSEPLRQELIARGIEPSRVVCHPNGFDQTLFDPARFTAGDRAALRASHAIPTDAVVATFVGTFGMWHGADILAQALIRLQEQRPDWLAASRLHLVFVGDGVNRPATEAMLAGRGLEPHYTFTGLVAPQDAPAYLAASDFFVAPHVPNPDGSEFFGSPTKLFEYLGMGRPVVASRLAQIGEVLAGSPDIAALPRGDGEASEDQVGVLVHPGDVAELAEGLIFVTDTPAWRVTAGVNARRRALNEFTWGHHVGAILAGLHGSLPPTRPAPRPAPPRILVNAVHSKSGGGLTYLRNVLPLLVKRHGMEVHVAVQTDQSGTVGPICEIAEARVHILPTVSRLATVMVQEQVSIPALARQVKADLVFSPANYGPVLVKRSVILLRNAFEVTTLEERWSKRIYWLGVKLLSRLCFATCRRAIIVSHHASRAFLDVFGLDDDPRIDVVHHGVGTLFHPPAGPDERPPCRLLAVSDIYVQKNFETLLRALVVLKPEFPEIHLDIAGKELDPAYAERLRGLCRQLGIMDRVHFLGGLAPDRIAALYREATVFVFPSLVETFGNPLVEAMASGLPVVCSDSAAMPEITGAAALLARPRDPDHMAEQIGHLLRDAALWRETSRKGIARAKDFSWERTADMTARILCEAAED